MILLAGCSWCIIGEFGAQVNQDMLWANQRYQYARGGCVLLSGSTDQSFDHPGVRKLSANHVLDEMPKSGLIDFAVDSSWK